MIYSACVQIWRLRLQQLRRYDGKRQNWKWVMWSWPSPFYSWFVIRQLEHDIIYLRVKFDDSRISCSRDMVGAHHNLNGSRDLTTPLSGTVCHPRARELALATIRRPQVFAVTSLHVRKTPQAVFQSVVLAKLLFVYSAWWGFTTADDRQRTEAVVRRGLYPGDGPAAEQFMEDSDDALFSRLMSCEQHVLHGLFPDKRYHDTTRCTGCR